MTALTIGEQLAIDFSGNVALYGRLMQLKHYVPTYSGTAYDQNYLTASGATQYAYAMDFPIGGNGGGQDFKLLAQGQIQYDDHKMFFNPYINFSGAHVKISISGTSITEIYAALPDGALTHSVQGIDIYKKVFVRKLNTGSFAGEF